MCIVFLLEIFIGISFLFVLIYNYKNTMNNIDIWYKKYNEKQGTMKFEVKLCKLFRFSS